MDFDRVSLFNDKISIRIPHDWVEEEDDDDGMYMFHDPDIEVGWYRVSLIKNETENIFLESDLEDLIASSHKGENELFKAGKMFVAVWHENAKFEDDMRMFYWEAGAIVNPKLIRSVIFSLAVKKNRIQEKGFAETLSMIQECVFATQFERNVN